MNTIPHPQSWTRKLCLLMATGLAALLIIGFSLLTTGLQPATADSTIIYVNHAASGEGTGLSWTDAYTSVQSALSAADYGNQVWVASGVYYPAADASDRTAAFLLKNGVEVYGGFAGGETSLSERDWQANLTVLSGDLDRNDTTGASGVITTPNNISGSNAYHVVAASAVTGTAVLDGFTLTAGQANGSGSDRWGGGMYLLSGANPTLRNLVFEGNLAYDNGGGLYNASGSPELTNVAFISNKSGVGGGMYTNGGDPILNNVLFAGNNTNVSGGFGGGMYIDSGNPTLVNTTFAGNLAYASTGSGGLRIVSGNTTVTNSIFWGNYNGEINNSGSLTVTYSIVPGGYTGEGNLDVDPLFVAPVSYDLSPTAAGNYRLRYGSPAIDSGNTLSVTATTDLDGNPRIVPTTVDRGAYEYQNFVLTVNQVGNGVLTKEPDQPVFTTYDTVVLTATADTGWSFTGWSGDLESSDNPFTLSIEGNTTITATFTQITYSLDIALVGNGSVVKFPDQALFNYGDVVTLTATADPAWVFAGWTGDIVSSNNPLAVTITGNTAITSTFTTNLLYLPVVVRFGP